MGRYDRSLQLFQAAAGLIPGGSQTNSKRPTAFAYGAYPIYARRAEGCRVWDIDGNEYIDFVMGCGPILLGYQYAAVDEAVREQLQKGIISGLLYPVEEQAARLLTELVPCAEMVRFLKGGGEATSAAARIARAFTGREVILNNGYRGWPDVWTAANNDGGVPQCLEPLIESYPLNDIPAVKQLFHKHKDQVAAVFISLLGTVPTAEYLQAVCDLAHENGALFVMDEVITGFRLAPGGAQEYFGVTPDLACFAKGMANGMPVSAVAGRAEVMRIMQDLWITVTYGGEALSLAAAVASMREIRDKNVPDHLWRLGRMMMEGLVEAAASQDIRFKCFGFAPCHSMLFEDVVPANGGPLWTFVLQEMAARGVLFRREGINCITFSHTEEDIREVIEKAREVFGLVRPYIDNPEGILEHVKTTDVTESQPAQ